MERIVDIKEYKRMEKFRYYECMIKGGRRRFLNNVLLFYFFVCIIFAIFSYKDAIHRIITVLLCCLIARFCYDPLYWFYIKWRYDKLMVFYGKMENNDGGQ